ncbi:MAG: hypothetical protein HOQ03_01250 [Thermoleophilia bacterium]|nr:hypothetical protein [Thermoleophilia bacterium]
MNRLTRIAVVTATALACTASPALADDVDYTSVAVLPSWTAASAVSCADPDTAPLLSSFKDDGFYAPAPGGTFDEGAGGWQLEGGASVGAAEGGLNVLGMSSGALDLPVGASATSPTFCVDERFPHFRFTYAQESLDEDSDVRVEVVYPGLAKDNVRKAKDLKAKHGRGWSLTDKVKLNPTHGLKQGGWRLLAVRITVRDGKPGSRVRVDDILIDPKARR